MGPKLICTSLFSNYGAHESNEGRCQGHEPRCSRSSTLGEHGAEEGHMCEGSEELGRDRHAAGEECGKVRAPWLVHDQDTLEAGDEGWQEGGLWKVVMVKAKPARTVVK